MELSEDVYFDAHKEYKYLISTKELFEKYPQLKGVWDKDMKQFLEIFIQKKGINKPILKQEPQAEETPKVIWNTQSENRESSSKESE